MSVRAPYGWGAEGVREVCGPGAGRVPGGAAGVGQDAPRSPYCPLALRTPEVPPVRQFSAPVRWAAVVAVTVAASTGCMSVGDDDGKPAPTPTSEPKGSVAGPDGGTVAGTGRARARGGRAEAHSEREAAESPQPRGSAGPSGSPGGVRPGAEPGDRGDPGPAAGGGLPAPSVSRPGPGPGAPQQPESPSPSATPEPPASPEPEPEPSEPSPQPSASSAAQLRTDAMSASGEPWPLRTPDVSPQVSPV